jgi:hypothetical protein
MRCVRQAESSGGEFVMRVWNSVEFQSENINVRIINMKL